MYLIKNKNQIQHMTVCEFIADIHLDKFNIECTVMCYLKINTHEVLRAYCLPSLHLINCSPFCFMMFILERKKISFILVLSLDNKTRISDKMQRHVYKTSICICQKTNTLELCGLEFCCHSLFYAK